MISLAADIHNCNVIEFSKIHNRAGNITVFQNSEWQLFDIKRAYYLYDVPGGSERGGHAHKELYQLVIAASGSFDIIVDDGRHKKIIELNRPYFGLLIVPGIWREVINFSSGAICLVLASEKYNPNDYIRDYTSFKKFKESLNAD
jgi:dTDP-4-dehydrorhamnose 3,5-epimerase-like enzyme